MFNYCSNKRLFIAKFMGVNLTTETHAQSVLIYRFVVFF